MTVLYTPWCVRARPPRPAGCILRIMRYRVQREEQGVTVKVNCPDCKLTAWQQVDSDALYAEEPPADEDITPYMESVRDGLAERLSNAGCAHPMDDDAVSRIVEEIRGLFPRPATG